MHAVSYSSRLRDDGSISFPIKKYSTKMASDKQQRMDDLLCRHREGNISFVGKRELEGLVFEAQLLTVEKARRSLRISARNQR